MNHRIFQALAALALTLLMCGSARAQGAPEAEALIERGTQRVRDGDNLGGYEDLMRARAMRADWRASANGGHAACQLKRYAEAATLLREAIVLLPTDLSDYAEVKMKFDARWQQCAAHAGAVRFIVDPAGAEVLVDGKPVGRAPIADVVYVKAGRCRVQARLAGHEPVTITVDATAGRETAATMTLRVIGATHQAPLDPMQPNNDSLNGLGIAATVLGAVGIVTGISLILAASNESGDAKDMSKAIAASYPTEPNPCGDGPILPSDCPGLRATAESAERLEAGGLAALTVGGAVTVAGILMLLLDDSAGAEETGGLNLNMVPLLTPNYGGFSVQGKF